MYCLQKIQFLDGVKSHTPQVSSSEWDFSQRLCYANGGGGVTLKWRNLTNYQFSQEIQVNSNNKAGSYVPLMKCAKNGTSPLVFFPKSHNHSVSRRKNTSVFINLIDITITEKLSTKYLNSTPHDFQGHQKQGMSRNLLQPRKTQRDMMAKYNMVFR